MVYYGIKSNSPKQMRETCYVNSQSTQFQLCDGIPFAASGSLLLAYAINLGLPFCIWYNVLPVANLLVSEYK